MKAVLKNYRQSPRKVRLIADLVRGKRVPAALASLQFIDKRAALPFAKVIRSAAANGIQKGNEIQNLVIERVSVDKGVTYKRFMPRARGSASRINRRNCHISVELKAVPQKKQSKA